MKETECTPGKRLRRNFATHAQLFKALSDEHRLKIFATIAHAGEEVCVCDLTDAVPLLQPTVSHHLRVLKEVGLILSERRGTWVYYQLAPGAMDLLATTMGHVAPGIFSTKTLKKAG